MMRKTQEVQVVVEEIFNALSHGLGVLLGIAVLVSLVVLSAMRHDTLKIVSSAVYGTTFIVMYLASTLYHSYQKPKIKNALKIFDHASIYFFIAGSYTPFTLISIQGEWGWSLFGVIWGLALFGLVFKLFFTGRFEFLSVTIYLCMGWLIVIAIKPMIHHMPLAGLVWLMAGGLAYTIGVIFYVMDSKYYFSHFMWHLCVLLGSIFQFLAVLLYVIE